MKGATGDSDSAFVINLSPVLRRAHTTFFDQKQQSEKQSSQTMEMAPPKPAKRSRLAPVVVTDRSETRASRANSKASKQKKRDQVGSSQESDNVYTATSKWNDVISEKEIQKLVNATC